MVFEVKLEATPTAGNPPLKVTFKVTIAGGTDPISWLLDFGDGEIVWGEPPVPKTATVEHTYKTKGVYEAVLGAHDPVNPTTVSRVKISVNPTPFQEFIAWINSLPIWLKVAPVASIVTIAILLKRRR